MLTSTGTSLNHASLPANSVCSYDEESGPSEGKVKDPELAKHLEFFGLDITKFKKTEKSTLEMELDMNQK